ncbi:MAG TPA: iron ABC transporter permease [Beijerinckia sp.]|jgi:iron complex transport system permease protein|nr:iron ABC transporter permease [Beijerinckia sp.]
MSIASSIERKTAPAGVRAARGSLLLAAFLIAIFFGVACLALTIGRYPLHLRDIVEFFAAAANLIPMPADRYDLLHNVIIEIRLPRILGAGFVGAALAVSGAAYQSVFRNPLVSPGLLGVLGGASFGAALAILISGKWFIIQLLAFLFGLFAVMLGLGIAHLVGPASIITLVLGGMISGAFFTAALSILKYMADPYDQLPAIVYWLMGSLGGVDLRQVIWLGPPVVIGIMILSGLGRALDALSMGEDEARSLGVPVEAVRYGVIALATFVSALSVSIAGMIGWVGLIVPHFARMIVGPCNARLLPVSAIFGAIFLICADCLARTIGQAEIPIGIMTELLGIPAFLLVLRRARKGWA